MADEGTAVHSLIPKLLVVDVVIGGYLQKHVDDLMYAGNVGCHHLSILNWLEPNAETLESHNECFLGALDMAGQDFPHCVRRCRYIGRC